MLSIFANGQDQTPVSHEDYRAPIKSIGNSTTTPRDLLTEEDVKIVVYVLAESVAARLRENCFKCKVVEISIRDNGLFSFTRQRKVKRPTDITGEIAEAAMRLFHEHYSWYKPIRSIGVRACELTDALYPEQLDLFFDENLREKKKQMDITVDDIRRRFGFHSIQRGMMYRDAVLSKVNAKENHTVHPTDILKKEILQEWRNYGKEQCKRKRIQE